MIKQTSKPIQLTKSMLINILRDMEAKHLKSATIYDRDSEEHVILSIEEKEIKDLIDLPQQNYRILPAGYNPNKLGKKRMKPQETTSQ